MKFHCELCMKVPKSFIYTPPQAKLPSSAVVTTDITTQTDILIQSHSKTQSVTTQSDHNCFKSVESQSEHLYTSDVETQSDHNLFKNVETQSDKIYIQNVDLKLFKSVETQSEQCIETQSEHLYTSVETQSDHILFKSVETQSDKIDTPDIILEELRTGIANDVKSALRSMEQSMFEQVLDAKTTNAALKIDMLLQELEMRKKDQSRTERELGETRKTLKKLQSDIDKQSISINSAEQPNSGNDTCKCNKASEFKDLKMTTSSLMTQNENLKCNLEESQIQLRKEKEARDSAESKLYREEEKHQQSLDRLSSTEAACIATQETLNRANEQCMRVSDELLSWKTNYTPTDTGWKNVEAKPRNKAEQTSPQTSNDNHPTTTTEATSTQTSPTLPTVENIREPHNSDNIRRSNPDEKIIKANTPDVLIIGNSHVSRIQGSRLFRDRYTRVVSLTEKNLDGAIGFVRHTTIQPKLCILQASSNSLVNENIDDCLKKTETLINMCGEKFPGTKIYLSDPLPRMLYSSGQTEAYNNKIRSFKDGCKRLHTQQKYHIIEHVSLQTFSSNFYSSDGVHLNPYGVAELVRHYKAAISYDLGLTYNLHHQQRQDWSQQYRSEQRQDWSQQNRSEKQSRPQQYRSEQRQDWSQQYQSEKQSRPVHSSPQRPHSQISHQETSDNNPPSKSQGSWAN